MMALKCEGVSGYCSKNMTVKELLNAVGLLTSGQLSEAVEFLRRHPKVLGHITLLSASSTSGE